jgi:hypothetical protein
MSSKSTQHQVEFSGPRTPQRNGKVEQKFQTFYGRIRPTLNNEGLEDSVRTVVSASVQEQQTSLPIIPQLRQRRNILTS